MKRKVQKVKYNDKNNDYATTNNDVIVRKNREKYIA